MFPVALFSTHSFPRMVEHVNFDTSLVRRFLRKPRSRKSPMSSRRPLDAESSGSLYSLFCSHNQSVT
jgi:hypothetical protein